ncbi:MAG: hypothetical protein V2J62_06095 [candidate division KSB1 bacterium]|jgi:hypothetical protein|nr:hypothetical protein [candidate division KSB1 bacterium]
MRHSFPGFNVSTAALYVTLSILIIIGFMKCNGVPCCPEIEYFYTQQEWICAKCPDSGARLFYKFNYTKYGNGAKKPCDGPGLMGLKNMTYHMSIDPDGKFIKTGTGTYVNASGGTFLKVDKTSTIRLIITGDKECDAATKEVQIRVVAPGDKHKLCFPHNDLPWPQGFWTGKTNVFGQGVVVHHIENPNPFSISVTLDGITAPSIRPNQTSNIHKGKPASGTWTFQIDSKAEYNTFIQSGAESLCVIVYLDCNCP